LRYATNRVSVPAPPPTVVPQISNADNVAPGQHTVTVIMSGNNHISVATPVTASVTFSVR
jgi:hypothetical protein